MPACTAQLSTPLTVFEMKRSCFVAASFLAATVLLTGSLLSGCSARLNWQGFSGRYAFHTTADLRLLTDCDGLPSEEEGRETAELVEELLHDLDESLSVTDESSSVYAFNAAAPGKTVQLDRAAYDVFVLAQELYEETDGYYDPTVFHSVEAYGFYNFTAGDEAPDRLPSEEQLTAFRTLSSYFPEIVLWEEDGMYYAQKPEGAAAQAEGETYVLKVDFGGIGKGYAADRVKELTERFSYGYFSFSGSSMAVRKYTPERAYFELSVAAPRDSGHYLTANVQDTCLSTSADNGLYYEIGGTRYSQIINPKTMMPVNVKDGKNVSGIVTATVLGESAARCDALTTALMAMGRERALQFLSTIEETVWFVELDGEELTVYTNAPEESYSLAAGYENVVTI